MFVASTAPDLVQQGGFLLAPGWGTPEWPPSSSCRSGFDSFSVALDFWKFSCRFGSLCHAFLYLLPAHLHHGGNKTRGSNPPPLFSVVRINSHEIFCNCTWLPQIARFQTVHLQNGFSAIWPPSSPVSLLNFSSHFTVGEVQQLEEWSE